jgi:DAACS family dicarboxylate/amino acid:cation (Na+ or H+) symporter
MVAILEAIMPTMFKITKWNTALAPIAIFVIMAWLFTTRGLATVVALAKLVIVMYLGLVIMVLIFWLILLLIGELRDMQRLLKRACSLGSLDAF